MVPIRFVDKLLRLAVAAEIVAHEVVVAVLDNGITESGETAGVAKLIGFDGVKDFGEFGIQVEGAVAVGVTEVFHVFSQVAKEEDVGFANLAGNFNLLRKSVSFEKLGMQQRLTLAPSHVPIINPPFRTNFILLVPLASVPAVEICSLISEAGVMISALLTL